MTLLSEFLAPDKPTPARHPDDEAPGRDATLAELRDFAHDLTERIHAPLRELVATLENVGNVRTLASDRTRFFSVFVPPPAVGSVQVLGEALDRAAYTLLPLPAGSGVWLGDSQNVINRGSDAAQFLGGFGATVTTRSQLWAVADPTLSATGVTLSFMVEQWDANR